MGTERELPLEPEPQINQDPEDREHQPDGAIGEKFAGDARTDDFDAAIFDGLAQHAAHLLHRCLLRGIDKEFHNQKRDEVVDEYGRFYSDAIKMMYSKSLSAFDLKQEKEQTLRDYGDSQLGKQVIMARRLVESGVRFVEVSMGGWDTHQNGFTAIEANLNKLDPAVGTLIEDLNARGMLERTMVVCTGEFGRTPHAQGGDGRDHNNKGFTLWMAGGGVKGGLSYGQTDDYGYEAVENKVQIHDLHATILALLGLNHEKLTFNYAGRDFRLTDIEGNVVKAIMA